MTFESYECGCADGYFDINNNGRVCEACCDEIEFYLHESLNRICKFSHDLNTHFLFKRTILYKAHNFNICVSVKSNKSTTVQGGKFIYDCTKANESKDNGERLEYGREGFPGHLVQFFN